MNDVSLESLRTAFPSSPRSSLLVLILWSILGSTLLPGVAVLSQSRPANGNSSGTPPTERILEAPISLMSGLGQAHEPVSASSPKSQLYYDQGLSLLYSYDWIRAARSFHQALREDPNLAMAYLGLSFAFSGFGENDGAQAMLQKARLLANRASSREQLRIELRQKQLLAVTSSVKMNQYIDALDAALSQYPVDPILLLLRGNAAEGFAAGMGQHGMAESISYYERVLRIDPDNFAAHHFLVHSQELLGNVPEALRHAELYRKLAPGVPHAHHMLGHEVMRAGRLHEAIVEFELSLGLEEAEYTAEPEVRHCDWHHRHNLVLLASAYRQAGQLNAAEHVLKTLSALPVSTISDALYQKELPAFLLQTGRVDEAITAAQPMLNSKFNLTRALGHAIIGNACALNERVQCASAELKAVEAATAVLDRGFREVIANWVEILRAQISLQTTSRPAAVSALMQQELAMRRVSGTDAWSDALFNMEFIGSLAIKRGEWDLARFTAVQMQEHAPDYRGTHLVLARVAQHIGDNVTAEHELKLAEGNPSETPLRN